MQTWQLILRAIAKKHKYYPQLRHHTIALSFIARLADSVIDQPNDSSTNYL